MTAGFVHLFGSAGFAGASALQTALLRQGLGLRLHTEMSQLLAALSVQGTKPEPSLVLLGASFEQCCQAARQLRSVAPALPVMALVSPFTEAAVKQALVHGIVACWPASVPVDTLAMNLQRLLCHRQESATAAWRLNHLGWEIQSPHGVVVALTSAERALMLALCSAPRRRLSHDALDSVMGPAGSVSSEGGEPVHGQARGTGTRRMSVMMSRLRKKFLAAGLDLPIRSLRGVGYELCVELTLPHSLCAPATACDAAACSSAL